MYNAEIIIVMLTALLYSFSSCTEDLPETENTIAGLQIIADHTVVDRFDDIPQTYIDEVKKMWLSYTGESHSIALRSGLNKLESANSIYQVVTRESGTPDPYTTSNLRASRATWGDLNNASGWIYTCGEEDWFTSANAIARTKAGLAYIEANGPQLSAFGFGWCWDPSIDSPSDYANYIEATKGYIDYCNTNNINTIVFFTTGPVDGENAVGFGGYEKYLGNEQIRDSVAADPTRILFDYADIMCYDDNGSGPNTTTYNIYTYPIITTANLSGSSTGHIGSVGALRLAKAMWWMLARIAGWDGN